ncbi:6317_t:CDS:2 [Ambispora gerdemannii]|uniref:6317_t:CDS:1 n=1 Tax=Ambispora gerdemannii TaxID=144530 RepID=A0A9N8UZS6_9GLOM|nr:6317_t:CDS:2 [Ambispora gerdemannii]
MEDQNQNLPNSNSEQLRKGDHHPKKVRKSSKGLPYKKITEIQKKLRERLAKSSQSPPKQNEVLPSPVEKPKVYWNKELSFGERLQGLKNKPTVHSSWDKEREKREAKLRQTQEKAEERLRRMDPMMSSEERTFRASELAYEVVYRGKEYNWDDDSPLLSATNEKYITVDEFLRREEEKKKATRVAAQAALIQRKKSRPGFEGSPSTGQRPSNKKKSKSSSNFRQSHQRQQQHSDGPGPIRGVDRKRTVS